MKEKVAQIKTNCRQGHILEELLNFNFMLIQQKSHSEMATASSLLTDDHFLCSICLGVFTDPVTVPCGHNFCKECITQHWDNNDKSQCPLCQKVFNPRPELGVNTFLSELLASFRNPVQGKNTSEQQGATSEEVLCDVCSENKRKAVKSCQQCLLSYCEAHLELHQISDDLEHKLINHVEKLETCEKHGRPLDKFCKTDQVCVCKFCEMDHRRHDVVPLVDEYERKKKDLEETEAYTQQLILERQTKIEQVNQSVKLSKVDTDREKANSIRVFDSLIQSAESALVQLIEIIEESQKTAEKQAEGFIKELKEEIDKLMKRSSEMKQLFHTKDHNQLLQNSSSLILAVPTKDWSDIRICSSLVGNINAAETRLGVALNKEIKKMFITVEAKRVQQYAVDVTLDPETASQSVTLSEDGKRVKSGHTQKFKDGPRRCYDGVLGKQEFSSGKFYFEVLVEGKKNWVLGVVKELASRKYCREYNTSNVWMTGQLGAHGAESCASAWDVGMILQLGAHGAKRCMRASEPRMIRRPTAADQLAAHNRGRCGDRLITSDYCVWGKERCFRSSPDARGGCLVPVVSLGSTGLPSRSRFRRSRFGRHNQRGINLANLQYIARFDGAGLSLPSGKQSTRFALINARSNGFWTLRLTEENKYEAADSKKPIDVTTSPEKVGVYVSYEEKLVSFYDVDNAQLIYSITDCKFDEEVYPYLNPGYDFKGQNFAPLIICPVRAQKIK
nr:E3 ubiquitin-protein ligase TRIM47-like [Nothobranchius furzeri]